MTQLNGSERPDQTFASSIRGRTLSLVITGLLLVWLVVTAYLLVTHQGRLVPFLAALLVTVGSLLRTYALFTSTLALSPAGVRYFSSGATYLASWDSIAFSKRRFLWRTIHGLALSRPIQPMDKTVLGRLTMPLSVSFISLETFGWPSAQLRAALERHAPHLLLDKDSAA